MINQNEKQKKNRNDDRQTELAEFGFKWRFIKKSEYENTIQLRLTDYIWGG